MDGARQKKKRSELELLLGAGDAGGRPFSPRLPALSISSPTLPEAPSVETDEQLARRLHEELNGMRSTRRGPKATTEELPTSPTRLASPLPRGTKQPDTPGKAGPVARQASLVSVPQGPLSPLADAQHLPGVVAAEAGANDAAGLGAAGDDGTAEGGKRKRNGAPRDTQALLQQTSSTSQRAADPLSGLQVRVARGPGGSAEAPPPGGPAPPPPPPPPASLKQRYLASPPGGGACRAPSGSAATAGCGGGGTTAVTPSSVLEVGRASCLLSASASLEGASCSAELGAAASGCGSLPLPPAPVSGTTAAGATCGPPVGAAARAPAAPPAAGASGGGCSSTDETEADADGASGVAVAGECAGAPSATSPKPAPAVEDTGVGGGAGSGGSLSGLPKLPKLPMIRAGRGWYRGRLLRECGASARVLVEVPGAPGGPAAAAPTWLPVSSDRIWRGSYKGKDWKYLGDGAWEPKPAAFKRGKQGSSSNGLPLPLPAWAVPPGTDGRVQPAACEPAAAAATAGGAAGDDAVPARAERGGAARRDRSAGGAGGEDAAAGGRSLRSASRASPAAEASGDVRAATAARRAALATERGGKRAAEARGDESASSGSEDGETDAEAEVGEQEEQDDDDDDARAGEQQPRGAQRPPATVAAAAGAATTDAAKPPPPPSATAASAAAAAVVAQAADVKPEPEEAPAPPPGGKAEAAAAAQAQHSGELPGPAAEARACDPEPMEAQAADGSAAAAGAAAAVKHGDAAALAAAGQVATDAAEDECWVPGRPFPRTHAPRRAAPRRRRLRTPLDGMRLGSASAAGGGAQGEEWGGEGEAAASDADRGRRGSEGGGGAGGDVPFMGNRRRAAARAAAVAAAAARAEEEAAEEEEEELARGRQPRRDRHGQLHYPSGGGARRTHPPHAHGPFSAHAQGGKRAAAGKHDMSYGASMYGDSSGAADDGYGGGEAAVARQRSNGAGRTQGGSGGGTPAWEAPPGWRSGSMGGAAGGGSAGAAGRQSQQQQSRSRRKGKPSRSRACGEDDMWAWDGEGDGCGGLDAEHAAWVRMPEALRRIYYASYYAEQAAAAAAQQEAAAARRKAKQAAEAAAEAEAGSYRSAQAPLNKRRRAYDDCRESPELEADDHDADYMPYGGGSMCGSRRYSANGGRRCSGSGAAGKRARDTGGAEAELEAVLCALAPAAAAAPPRRHILVSGGPWGAAAAGAGARGDVPCGLAGLLEAALMSGMDLDDAPHDQPQPAERDAAGAEAQEQAQTQSGCSGAVELLQGLAALAASSAPDAVPDPHDAPPALTALAPPGAPAPHAAHVALSDSSGTHSGGEGAAAEAATQQLQHQTLPPLGKAPGLCGLGGSPQPLAPGLPPQVRPGTPTRARRTGRPPSVALGAGAPLPKLPALSSSASLRLQLAASGSVGAPGGPVSLHHDAYGLPLGAGSVPSQPSLPDPRGVAHMDVDGGAWLLQHPHGVQPGHEHAGAHALAGPADAPHLPASADGLALPSAAGGEAQAALVAYAPDGAADHPLVGVPGSRRAASALSSPRVPHGAAHAVALGGGAPNSCSVLAAIGELLAERQPVMQQLALRAAMEVDSLGLVLAQQQLLLQQQQQQQEAAAAAAALLQHADAAAGRSRGRGSSPYSSGSLPVAAASSGGMDELLGGGEGATPAACYMAPPSGVPDALLSALPTVAGVAELYSCRKGCGGAEQALAELPLFF